MLNSHKWSTLISELTHVVKAVAIVTSTMNT